MRRLLGRLRSLLLHRRVDREMQEEMRQHLERATERMVDRGLSPDEARRAALREFGNVHYLQEQSRDVRGGRWLGALTPDAKLALRMLVKNPLLSVVGGLGMAVAIAIAMGFFAFMTFYYSDPPVEEGERVVTVEYISGDVGATTLFDYQLWKVELESVQEVAAYQPAPGDFDTPTGGVVRSRGVEMTASGFRVARVPPLLGRYLLDSDEVEGAPPVVVIGHREWQQAFDGDPDAVGTEVQLDGTAHTVVGVMPEGFRLPGNHGVWTALETGRATDGPGEEPDGLVVFGRLAPGVERAAAAAEAAAIGERVSDRFPDVRRGFRPMVSPYIRHLLDVQQYPAWVVWLMQLFAALVLTLVAVNVAVLVYARTALRTAEITVRTALGASRGRIVMQLFLEALALSIIAAGLGLLMAQVGFRQMQGMIDFRASTPYWLVGDLPAETVLYAAGLALLAAFVVGALPALQATGRRLQSTLRALGGGTGLRMGRTWTALICVQVAVAVGVLPAVVGVAWNYAPRPTPAFAASEILSFHLWPSEGAIDDRDTPASDSAYARLQAELLRRAGDVPGIVDVTFASSLPLRGRGVRVEVEGGEGLFDRRGSRVPTSHQVDPDYFEAMGVSLLAGRPFDRGDLGETGTAAIVNQAFVDDFLGGGAALGRRFRELELRQEADGSEPWFEVVGVVEDMLIPSRRGASFPATYHPIDLGTESLSLAARTRGIDPTRAALRLRELSAGLAPGHDLFVNSMDDFYQSDRGERALLLTMVSLITLSVLLLSAAGISAMMSFAVTRRQREIGVRTALGATRRQLVTSIFSRAGRQLGVGLLVGGATAVLLDGLTDGVMLGGQAAPLLTLVAAIMLIAGLLATLGPARRALRVQPMDALREE